MSSLPILDNISNSSVASATGITWSHTVSPLANMILIIALEVGGGTTISSATYAGAALTQLTTITEVVEGYIFYKLSPAMGTNNVVINWGAVMAEAAVAAVDYSNVVQAGPFGTPATAGNSSSGNSSNTVATTSASNQLVIDCNCCLDTSSSPASGQTVRESNTAQEPIYFADILATGSNMTLNWTNTPSTGAWLQMSVALNGIVSAVGLRAPLVVPGAVIGPSIWQGPPGLKYPSKMGPVIRRANGIFRGGGGLMGKNSLRRKWWQVL